MDTSDPTSLAFNWGQFIGAAARHDEQHVGGDADGWPERYAEFIVAHTGGVDVETLAAVLREARDAHHVYEQALGTQDPNWQMWYGEYVAERL